MTPVEEELRRELVELGELVEARLHALGACDRGTKQAEAVEAILHDDALAELVARIDVVQRQAEAACVALPDLERALWPVH